MLKQEEVIRGPVDRRSKPSSSPSSSGSPGRYITWNTNTTVVDNTDSNRF